MLVAAWGFLLGRAGELAPLVPFGVACFAVLPDLRLGLGVVAGAAAGGGLAGAGPAAAALAVCWLLRRRLPVPAASAIAAALPPLLVAADRLDGWALAFAAVTVTLGAMLAPMYGRAQRLLLGEGVEGSSGPAGVQTLASLAVVAGSAVAGLGGWFLGPFDVAAAAASLCVATAARRGVVSGVLAGVGVGAVDMLAAGAPPAALASFALGGLAGGLAAPWSPYGPAVGALVGQLAVYFVDPSGGAAWGAVAGAALACAVPAAWLTAPRLARVRRVPPPERLKRVAGAVEAMLRALKEAAPTTGRSAAPQDRLAATVCPGCRSFSRCWERNPVRAGRMLGDLAVLAEVRSVTTADVGGPATIDCLRRGEMARAANLLVTVDARDRQWRERLAAERRQEAVELRALAGVLGSIYGEAAAGRGLGPLRLLAYETGVARLPRPGSSVSGDTLLVRELADGRLCLALSDGMGSGPAAARESLSATTLLEALLDAGFAPDAGARAVNRMLHRRSDGETFATLDLALVDLATGTTEWWKLGSAPGLRVRGTEVEQIAAGPVPAGVFADVEPHVVRRVVRPGDVLILTSDGVTDAGRPRDPWLPAFVADLGPSVPDALAQAILAEAVARSLEQDHDDLTVVVCRLSAAGSVALRAK